MRSYLNAALLPAMWLAISALPASAEMLKVDFGATGQDVMSGFSEFTETANPTYNSVTKSYTSSLGTSGTVDVTVSANGNMDFRNRGDNSTTMGNLIEDHTKTEAGSKLYLTFDYLKAGQYTITTYHHENFDSAMCDINVLLDDKNGIGQSIATNVPQPMVLLWRQRL